MNIRPAATCVKRRRQNLSDGRGPTCGRASQSGASTPGRNPHRTRRQRHDRRGRGLWRGARRALAGRRGSLLPRRHGAQRGDVRSARPALRVSQPRHPCLRERGVRNRRACGSRPASRRRRRERARRRASPTRGVNPVSGPGAWTGESLRGSGNHPGRQRDRLVRCEQPGAPANSTTPSRQHPDRASVSARPPTGRGGCGLRDGRRFLPTDAVLERPRPAPATESGAPTGEVP